MNELETALKQAIRETVIELFSCQPEDDLIMIETPKDSDNGDYSTNIAMRLARTLHDNPRNIAQKIVEGLQERLANTEKIEIAGPGFINFWMKKAALADIINTVLTMKDDFGRNNSGNGLKVLVEYVSANPTGPLHCGHARGAAWGDVVCRLMKKSGYDVLREYYINDAGHQIDMLGESIYARYLQAFGIDCALPEDGYHGPDVIEVTNDIIKDVGDRYLHTDKGEAVDFFKWEGRTRELERIKKDLAYFRCEFDSWISERWIVDQHMIESSLKRMQEKGLTYEKDGAIWFRSTEYGDDKDRVLRKSDGFYTYLTPDIANHLYKIDRGYQKLVNFWGADHHGYIARMKAAIEALGYPKDALEVDLIQMVRLVENGVEVKMSKRTGNAITIRELVDDIGCDAARYFFVSKAVDTHMDLDLTLAKSQSNDNPVFYAQYAHARMCSILKQAPAVRMLESYDLLTDQKETELLKHLNSFTGLVGEAAASRLPNKICNYIQKLAADFHSFYGSCRVNDPANPELTAQRLALLEAARITLHNALELLGVTAPEKM
jgi:arginyl-tRNA synthetase